MRPYRWKWFFQATKGVLESKNIHGIYIVYISNILVPVLNQLLTPCSTLRSSAKGYGKDKSGNNPKTLAGTSSGLPSQNSTRRGLGISAWGIVILVVSIIVAGMALYYFSVCYPMCQGYSTSNRYDKMPKMGLPTMAWNFLFRISWTYL